MKRKNVRKIYAAALAAVLTAALAACGRTDAAQTADIPGREGAEAASGGRIGTIEDLPDPEEMFTDRDMAGGYEESESIVIVLTGSSASCEEKSVSVSGNTVTITEEGTYVLSGSLEGMIVVDAADTDKVQLVLNGVEISDRESACIYAKEADKLFITLAEGSRNSISGESYTVQDDNNVDGAVFSQCDLTVNGPGSLSIQAGEGNGVVSKDDLAVTGGTVTVTAQGHGLEGKDSVRIAGGKWDIVSGKDGIHSENKENGEKGFVYIAGGELSVVSDGDGISAGCCMQIDGGSFRIVSDGAKGVKSAGEMWVKGGSLFVDSQDDALHADGDLTVCGGILQLSSEDDGIHSEGTVTVESGELEITDSYEGIEGSSIVIAGGEIRLNALDDGMNAAGGNDQSGFGGRQGDGMYGGSDSCITISGGSVFINAAGDGIDSNGDLIVTGGETYVSGPENDANGALDYGGRGQITGGILAAVGSPQMAVNFGDSSTQGSILTNVPACRAGDRVTLKDDQGNVLVDYTAESSFRSVVVSCPQLQQGGTYILTAGDSDTEITLESLIYGGRGGFEDRRGFREERRPPG